MLTTTFALAFASLVFAQSYDPSVQPNGTETSSVAPPSRITTVTVPSPVFETATVTVTFEGSTYTTTYASYAGTPRTFQFFLKKHDFFRFDIVL